MARQLKNAPIWIFLLLLIVATTYMLMGPQKPYSFPRLIAPFDLKQDAFFLWGTTSNGRDMFQAVMFGSGYSIWLGVLTTLLIGFIGVFVGLFMGYYHKNRWHVGPFTFFCLLVGTCAGYFYGFGIRKYPILDAANEGVILGVGALFLGIGIFLILLWLFFRIGNGMDKRLGLGRPFQLGEGMLWLLQVIDSLPTLLLLITLMAVFKEKSLVLVMVLIALTSWAQLALLVRGQVLKEGELPYIEAARMLGMRDLRIFRQHLLPNILPSVGVVLALTVGRVIIAESSLGFLGLISDYEGLGGLLSRSRSFPDYPWLGIFPGMMLAVIMLLIHQIGERFKLFE